MSAERKTIDLIYRFDPSQPAHEPPKTADEARRLLESGNRKFARWIDSCEFDKGQPGEALSFVVPCSEVDLGLVREEGTVASQEPFAVMLGCSDARVPAETIFGAVRNNLFVIRVAGNILSTEGVGSIDYAVQHVPTVQIAVVLGHTGCGAVAAAVDSYLDPWPFLETTTNPALRSIVERLLVPVRTAAQALRRACGEEVARQPGYRAALIETSEMVNAMYTAFGLRLELARTAKKDLPVYYGVFDLAVHRIRSAPRAEPKGTLVEVILADAPADLKDFEALVMRVAGRAERLLAPKGSETS